MELQKMLSLTRQVVDQYRLIEPNDRIAVGISGGKDSLAILYTLANLRRFYPIPFDLEAITVDLGFSRMDYSGIQVFCRELEVPYTIVPTQIGPIVFDARKEPNPCSLCAKMRRGALNQKAKELGCTAVAYGHHRRYQLPVVQNVCPADHNTRREEMKHLLSDLKKQYPDLINRLVHAAEHSSIEDWIRMNTRCQSLNDVSEAEKNSDK